MSDAAQSIGPKDQPTAGRTDTFVLHEVPRASYEVGRELARVGMGRILEGWDVRHRRHVAIKVLLRSDVAFVLRFTRETRVTAQLQHPGIVPVYEAGCWPDGEPFFATKLVRLVSSKSAWRRTCAADGSWLWSYNPLTKRGSVPIAVRLLYARAHG